MKCVDVEKYSEDFIENSLDFAARQKFERHLEECFSCRKAINQIQESGVLLKKASLISLSPHFDAKMMRAYNSHFEKQPTASFRATLFNTFSISKPALSMAILTLIAFSALAFQLGKMSARNTANLLTDNSSNEEKTIVKVVENRIEVPVIKTVEVPVYKEKIVSRIVYRNREIIKAVQIADNPESKFQETDFNARSAAFTYVQNGDENFTPINLKNFQPVSEMRIEIIKRGKDNDK